MTSSLDHLSSLNLIAPNSSFALTSIVCTIGPACQDPALLEQMIDRGMTIARLNFSHGTHEYHEKSIRNVRLAVVNHSRKIGRAFPLAIAIDTKGSEIRTGVLQGGISAEVKLEQGDRVKITTDETYIQKGNCSIIYVDYKNITKVVSPGNQIFIDDGLISLICERVSNNELHCIVENGGMLGSSKGVNLPGVEKDLPTVSQKDEADIKFGVAQGVDLIFASFTRNAEEVRAIRRLAQSASHPSATDHIRIIAKIENREGMRNMDEIIEEADGILIDRGDLGMEISFQKVFLAQKTVIAKCNKVGKPIVIATHLLESMVEKPRPTRAESSDVANAVLDGADCVMLAGETAKGIYPLQCVETMASICKEAEASILQKQLFQDLIRRNPAPLDVVQTTAIATVEASLNCLAAAIIVITKSGKSAQLISKYRPRVPIVAVTKNIHVARHLNLYRAILPLCFEGESPADWRQNVDARIAAGIEFGKSKGFIKTGDLVVIVTGWKQGYDATNTISLLNVD